VARGGAGLSCDEQGVALGPFPLVTRHTGKSPVYRLRPRKDIARAMRAGWRGMIPEIIDHVIEGLERVTQALNDGDHVRARIMIVQMRVPGLLPSALPKLAKAAGIQKYNPNWEDEARVTAGDPDDGQWTGGDGADASDGDPKPPQVAANDTDVMSDEQR
jgi:hypothetical protein